MFRHVSSDLIPLHLILFEETISLFEQNGQGKLVTGKVRSHSAERVGTSGIPLRLRVRVWTLPPQLMAGKADKSPLCTGRSPSFALGRLGGQSGDKAGLRGQGFRGKTGGLSGNPPSQEMKL